MSETVSTTAHQGLGDAVALGLGWGCWVGVIVASVDTLDAVLAGFQGHRGHWAWYALSSLVLAFGLMGSALGLWTGVSLRLTKRVPGVSGATLRAFLLGLPAGVFVGWVPTSWIREHWQTLEPLGRAVAVAVYPAAFLGSTLLAALARKIWERYERAGPQPLGGPACLHLSLLGVSIALAAGSYWADRRVLVDLYEDFHYGLSGVFVASCAVAVRLVWLTVRRPWLTRLRLRGIRAGALGAAIVSLWVLEQLSPDVFGPSSSVIFGKLIGTVRTWTDVDGDGTSSLFGGSDCAPFDATAKPGNFDMPGNGADEDCSGTSAEWPAPEPQPTYPIPDRSGYNVLLLTVDALRADHVGAWGYDRRPTTPNIDKLAAKSIRFAEAFSPSPKTYDALPSLLTGLYPSNVPRDYRVDLPKGGKRKPYLYKITDDVELLSETLHKRGYVTGAAHGVPILKSLRLDRGFDEHLTTRDASEFAMDFLNRRVLQAEKAKPFFVWLHYYSPHHTYNKHEGFDFGDDDIDRYDSEIAFDDQRIGWLLDNLEQVGLADRTIVIFTADHGEEFRDHGGTQHTLRLYRELTHVPLLLKIPGVEPSVVEDPVELADVAPTLCDLLRMENACMDHDGHSLLAALAGKRQANRGAYSEMFRQGDVLLMNSLYTGKWRLIYDYKRDRAELYDVEVDRTEQRNVARQHPELVQQLRDRLAVRPLYREGLVFQRYAETRDTLVLAEQLRVLRRPRLLARALDEIERNLRPEHAPHLKRLLGRPGLGRKLKQRAKSLLASATRRPEGPAP